MSTFALVHGSGDAAENGLWYGGQQVASWSELSALGYWPRMIGWSDDAIAAVGHKLNRLLPKFYAAAARVWATEQRLLDLATWAGK